MSNKKSIRDLYILYTFIMSNHQIFFIGNLPVRFT